MLNYNILQHTTSSSISFLKLQHNLNKFVFLTSLRLFLRKKHLCFSATNSNLFFLTTHTSDYNTTTYLYFKFTTNKYLPNKNCCAKIFVVEHTNLLAHFVLQHFTTQQHLRLQQTNIYPTKTFVKHVLL